MLDAYVIEEIKRRDRGKGADDRPVIELPIPPSPPSRPVDRKDDDDGGGDHGVVIIDYSG